MLKQKKTNLLKYLLINCKTCNVSSSRTSSRGLFENNIILNVEESIFFTSYCRRKKTTIDDLN